MEKVIVAFESRRVGARIRDILESRGIAEGMICNSGAQLRWMANKLHSSVVVCGYKLGGETAEEVFQDLPPYCTMLLLAEQSYLDLIWNTEIFRLAIPVSRGELAAAVRMLVQLGRRTEHVMPPRCSEDTAPIQQAKQFLMQQYGLTEENAHHFLQKKSMDTGMKMAQVARLVLDEV